MHVPPHTLVELESKHMPLPSRPRSVSHALPGASRQASQQRPPSVACASAQAAQGGGSQQATFSGWPAPPPFTSFHLAVRPLATPLAAAGTGWPSAPEQGALGAMQAPVQLEGALAGCGVVSWRPASKLLHLL